MGRPKEIVVVALLGFALWLCPCQLLAESRNFELIAPDLEVLNDSDSLFSPFVYAVRSSLSSFQIVIGSAREIGKVRASVKEIAEARLAICGINANFFDEHGAPLGLVISRGQIQQNLHRGGNTLSGVFQVSRTGPQIVHRDQFRPQAILEAVQAGPRLIVSGAASKVSRDDTRSRRSGVCLDKENRLILFFIDSFMGAGISIPDLQQKLLSPPFSCSEALNLDGGGSAQFFFSPAKFSKESQRLSIPGRDQIPVALLLVPKQD